MDSKLGLLKITVLSAVSDILSFIYTKGVGVFAPARGLKHDGLKNVYILLGELKELRDVEDTDYHFQISAIGLPSRYPIDIIEVIARKDRPNRPAGIYIRFNGGEIPMILYPNILVMNDESIKALIDVIVESNKPLLTLIEEGNTGGKNAVKKSGK